MKIKILLSIAASFMIMGCITAPPSAPADNNSSVLAISITVKQPVPIFTSNIETVYFIKLDNTPDILNVNSLIKSNYNNEDCIYLLNAEPGRYAAVAAFEKNAPQKPDQKKGGGRVSSYNSFYFSQEMIKLSEVVVLPGEISFMGRFTLRKPWSISFTNADEAQIYFSRLLQPDLEETAKQNSFLKLTFGTLCGSADYAVAVSSSELKKDLKSELDFLYKSLEHFRGSKTQNILYRNQLTASGPWQDIMNKRIEKINKIKSLYQEKSRWITNPEQADQ